MEHHEHVLQCIDNDDHNELLRLSKLEEDNYEAYVLRQYAAQAYQRAWGFDEVRDNLLV